MKYVLYNTRTSSIERIFDYEYLIDGKSPRFPDYIHLLDVIIIKDEIDFIKKVMAVVKDFKG